MVSYKFIIIIWFMIYLVLNILLYTINCVLYFDRCFILCFYIKQTLACLHVEFKTILWGYVGPWAWFLAYLTNQFFILESCLTSMWWTVILWILSGSIIYGVKLWKMVGYNIFGYKLYNVNWGLWNQLKRLIESRRYMDAQVTS